jgi:hypothetical protein
MGKTKEEGIGSGIQSATGTPIQTPAGMKFIVYNSDAYYPGADEYDNYVEAMIAFSDLKAKRIETIKEKNNIYSDTDYLAIVISEIDIKKLETLIDGDYE